MNVRRWRRHVATCVSGVVLTLGAGSPAGAQPAPTDPDAHVRVVDGAAIGDPVTIEVDGRTTVLELGEAAPFRRMAAGDHEVRANDGAVATITLAGGGRFDLVAVHELGYTQPPTLRLLDIAYGRVPTGQVGVRLLNLTADVGTLAVAVDGTPTGAVAAPYTASVRVAAPVDAALTLVDAETGERYASVPGGTDVADRFVTIAFVGGGETPLRPVVLVDGAQAPAPPDPTVPINTGDRGSTASEALWEAASLAVLAALAAVAFVLARERWLRGLLVGLVAVAAVTALVACSPDETGGRPASTVAVAPSTSPTTAAPTTTTAGPSIEAAADPVGLGIPSIGVLAPIRPTDPADAPRLFHPVLSVDTVGWFVGTSRPGDVGTAVLVGHNSDRPPLSAVFHRLPELVPGAEVVVRDAADAEHRFVVRSAVVWPKGALPPSLYDATPEATLVLVTCTGEHDPAGGRTHNVVVVATAP